MMEKLSKSYYQARNNVQIFHTAPELLDIRGSQFPDKEAIVIRDIGKPRETLTFGELKSKSEQLAAGMIKRGLKKGDCVGLFCSTSLEYSLCEYGLARTGAILIRFHISVKTGEDVKHLLKKGNCKWLLCHAGEGYENYRIIRNVVPKLEEHDPAKGVLEVDDLPDLQAIFMISSASYPGTENWTWFFNENTEDDLALVRKRQASVEMDDIKECFATSGSTGYPKLVARPYSMAASVWLQRNTLCGVTEADRELLDRPMSYGGGQTGTMLSTGITMVFVKTTATVSRRHEEKDFYFRMFEEERCTTLEIPIYLLEDLIQKIETRKIDPTRIKMASTGGERVKMKLIEKMMKYIPKFTFCMGSTETGIVLGTFPEDPLEKKVNYTGRGYFGELKIIDEDGAVVPVNTLGELCFRSACMFRFYWGDEEQTRMAKDALGWYKFGDSATMNEDGYVTVHGRKTEVISKATIKIYPVSIERELVHHPFVQGAVAVGIPHEVFFEQIALCAVPKTESTLTPGDLRQFCRERFREGEDGQGLMPDYFLIFDHFPLGDTGKIDRKKVREEAITRLKHE